MPYTYKKFGDKYCVFNKNTGKKMGCTKGDKVSLKKYLAALYTNAEQIKKEELKENIKKLIKQMINEAENVIMRSKLVNDSIENVIKKDIGIPFDSKEKQEVILKQGTFGIKSTIGNNNTEIKFATSDMFGNNKINVIKKLKNMSDPKTLVYANYFSVIPEESEEETQQNQAQKAPQEKPEQKIEKKTYVKLSQPFEDKNTDKLDILGDFIQLMEIK
jgi:hypothetical protein